MIQSVQVKLYAEPVFKAVCGTCNEFRRKIEETIPPETECEVISRPILDHCAKYLELRKVPSAMDHRPQRIPSSVLGNLWARIEFSHHRIELRR